MKSARFLAVASILAATTLSGATEKPWIEVRSPHFRLITNGDASDGSHVLSRFELMRAVFAQQFPRFQLDAPAPLLILAPRDESTTKRLLPGFASHSMPLPGGLYRHGWEREYALVRLDVINGPDVFSTVYHEYTHSLLHINLHWLPSWLDEGFADFYGYTGFEGTKVSIGNPPNSLKIRMLRDMMLIPFNDFLSSSMYTRDPRRTYESYLQAWALTHFLMFSPTVDTGKRLAKFIDMIEHGVPQKKAFQDAIGPFDQIQKEYEAYIHKLTLPFWEGSAPAKPDEKQFSIRTLAPGETEAELATWFIRSHEWEPMRQYAAAALQKGPNLSLAHEANGFLLYNEGHDAEALKEFSTAFELDNKNYIALFAKIMVAKSLPPAPETQQTYEQLSQVIDLKSDFAPAYIELAKLNIAKNDLGLALTMSRKAEKLEPFRAGYRVLSAKILLMMNQPTQAAAEASDVAERWSGPDQDEAMEVWNMIPAADRNPSPPDITSDDSPKKDWQIAEGVVKEVSCNGRAFAITLLSDGHTQTFKSEGFPVGYSDTLWVGTDHFTPCYHVQNLRVVLHYTPPKDSSYAGNLLMAGFRDDLPRTPAASGLQATTK